MTTAPSLDHALPPVLQRDEACPARGGRPPARTLAERGTDDASELAPNNNHQPRHNAQRWVEKVGRSIKGSGTPHLVKDRMDITGARWGLAGAEAILKLRALKANGDLEDYWHYHLTQERHHVHQARYHNNVVPNGHMISHPQVT